MPIAHECKAIQHFLPPGSPCLSQHLLFSSIRLLLRVAGSRVLCCHTFLISRVAGRPWRSAQCTYTRCNNWRLAPVNRLCAVGVLLTSSHTWQGASAARVYCPVDPPPGQEVWEEDTSKWGGVPELHVCVSPVLVCVCMRVHGVCQWVHAGAHERGNTAANNRNVLNRYRMSICTACTYIYLVYIICIVSCTRPCTHIIVLSLYTHYSVEPVHTL